jgi:hypothetical protein
MSVAVARKMLPGTAEVKVLPTADKTKSSAPASLPAVGPSAPKRAPAASSAGAPS